MKDFLYREVIVDAAGDCITIGLTASIVLLALSFGCLALLGGAFAVPSPRALAQRYLDAVVNEDVQAASKLAGSDKDCRIEMSSAAERDIALFGQAETRNVSIKIGGTGGSYDKVQIATIDFEYRKTPQSEWQYARIKLWTYYHHFVFGYACGAYMEIDP